MATANKIKHQQFGLKLLFVALIVTMVFTVWYLSEKRDRTSDNTLIVNYFTKQSQIPADSLEDLANVYEGASKEIFENGYENSQLDNDFHFKFINGVTNEQTKTARIDFWLSFGDNWGIIDDASVLYKVNGNQVTISFNSIRGENTYSFKRLFSYGNYNKPGRTTLNPVLLEESLVLLTENAPANPDKLMPGLKWWTVFDLEMPAVVKTASTSPINSDVGNDNLEINSEDLSNSIDEAMDNTEVAVVDSEAIIDSESEQATPSMMFVSYKDGQISDLDLINDKNDSWKVFLFIPEVFPKLCQEECSSLKRQYKSFEDLNAEVYLITPDLPNSLKAWSEMYFSELPFPLVSDPAMQLAKPFGLVDSGNNQLRGTVIIDDEGIVRYIGMYDELLKRNLVEYSQVISDQQNLSVISQ